jgi:hypothetical protein
MAAIVANDAKHVNTYHCLRPGKSVHIDLSYPMEAAHTLIEEVIAHRPRGARKSSEASTITELLLQVLHMLKVTISGRTRMNPNPRMGSSSAIRCTPSST